MFLYKARKKFILLLLFISITGIILLLVMIFYKQDKEERKISGIEEIIIRGRVIRTSDVKSVPKTLVERGLVLAIPFNKVYSLLSKAKIIYWDGYFGLLSLLINKELFTAYVKTSANIESGGKYMLHLSTGKYLLCVANLGKSPSDMFPIKVYGCVEVVVQEGDKELTLDLLLGIFGVTTPGKILE